MLSLVLLLLLTLGQVGALTVNITILDTAIEKGAVCLDGSAPAYLIDRGSDGGVNSWIIHLEGGGWCTTILECMGRANNGRGSSNRMSSTGDFEGILSNRIDQNPDFFNWNRVKVKYCDGSSYTGDVAEVPPGTNLHFRGARIFSAIMEDLLDKGMSAAENAILSGVSAGGIGAILNCDKFKSFLPISARVKCLSNGGFFVNMKTILGEPHIQELFNKVVTLHGSAKNLPPSCTSILEPSLCFFPQYAAQYVNTPLFIVNSAYDPSQVNYSLVPSDIDPNNVWGPCKRDINKCSPSQIQILQELRSTILGALTNVKTSSGYFIMSCYTHLCFEYQECWFYPYSPTLANEKVAEAVGRWFFKGLRFQHINCPYPCGKFCHV